MHVPRLRFAVARIFVFIALAQFVPARASQVRPVNLEEMTQRAATVFAGRCLDVHVERDAAIDRDVVVATFAVDRREKGALDRRVTVRMLSVAALEGAPWSPGEMLGFRPGEEVVLFLYGNSALGLTSPIGLGQGRFHIAQEKSGTTPAARSNLSQELVEDALLRRLVRRGVV